LVTGGAGFVGSHFVRSTLAGHLPGLADAQVTVLDKMSYAGNFANLGPVSEHERLDFVPGDVCDAALVDSVVRDHDAIVHFAAETSAGRAIAAAEPFVTSNVVGTQVLLDAALRHGIDRFLQVSTGEVYGSIDTGAPTERSPLAPASPYAATKAGADLLVLACHRTHGLPVVVTRGSHTYGPYQHPEKIIPRLVTGLLEGRTVTLHGDGATVRDWSHVDDHCRAVALALIGGRPGAAYHIGGSVELSDRDLAGIILRECGAGWDRVVTVEDPKGHDRRYALDDDKIRRDLGWRPRVEFSSGLAATVQWYRDNPDWWRPLLDT
jgi:dTDP-glucose 4,6-dehydratase